MSKLYAAIPGVTKPISVNVATSHSSSISTAQLTCVSTTKNIGDDIEMDIGYDDNHSKVFYGYVKSVDRDVPNNVVTLTASDILVRAIDFYIVSSNPENPFKRSNIKGETLVQEVLELSGLDYFDFDDTHFTFAVTSGVEAEVNLTSAYDYSKMIADLLAWHLYADFDGYIHFKNRKPYPMDGASGQPGDDTADVPLKTIYDTSILNISYRESDRDLRNRVVLYGAEGINAEASAISEFLPADFYKSMALVTQLIDDQNLANQAVEYNLALYNRLNKQISTNVEGDPDLIARSVVTINNTILDINSDWYIYSANHSWSRAGYTVGMELRQ